MSSVQVQPGTFDMSFSPWFPVVSPQSAAKALNDPKYYTVQQKPKGIKALNAICELGQITHSENWKP